MAIVDAVSYAGRGLPDVEALGADIYLFSLYKVYGPHMAALYGTHQAFSPGLSRGIHKSIDTQVVQWIYTTSCMTLINGTLNGFCIDGG